MNEATEIVARQVEGIREELAAVASERWPRYVVSDAVWKAHLAAAVAKWSEVELWARLAADIAAMIQRRTI